MKIKLAIVLPPQQHMLEICYFKEGNNIDWNVFA